MRVAAPSITSARGCSSVFAQRMLAMIPPSRHPLSEGYAGHIAQCIPERRGVHIVENLSGEDGDAGRFQDRRRGLRQSVGPLGEYHAARAKRCPLRTRRAGRRLTDRCVALVQLGAGTFGTFRRRRQAFRGESK
jgi:hypothetical protein